MHNKNKINLFYFLSALVLWIINPSNLCSFHSYLVFQVYFDIIYLMLFWIFLICFSRFMHLLMNLFAYFMHPTSSPLCICESDDIVFLRLYIINFHTTLLLSFFACLYHAISHFHLLNIFNNKLFYLQLYCSKHIFFIKIYCLSYFN